MKYCLLLSCLLMVRPSHGGLLLWSRRNIEIPALKHFSQHDFLELTRELQYPTVIVFQNELIENVSRCFNNMHSAYVPSANVDLEDLNDVNMMVFDEVNDILLKSCSSNDDNVLLLQIFPNVRSKREYVAKSNEIELPRGPVLYSADSALLYSAQPPLLKVYNNSFALGKSSYTQLYPSDKNSPLRLFVSITVVDEKKITLKFRFPSNNGYWSLTAIELVDVDYKRYILNITKVVEAPRRFSHHCFGETVFRDVTNNVELIFYALQVQPDTRDNRFGDAIDCVPFVTAPILSGLFIAFTLIIGLFVGLGALGSIKSMDKFDNCKTKQLSIALAE